MSVRCDTYRSGVRCEEDARVYLTIGCIHEHLDRTPICGGCLLEVRAQIGIHNFWCTPCQEGQRPHRCEIRELDEAMA